MSWDLLQRPISFPDASESSLPWVLRNGSTRLYMTSQTSLKLKVFRHGFVQVARISFENTISSFSCLNKDTAWKGRFAFVKKKSRHMA